MHRPIHYLLIASVFTTVQGGCASFWPPKPAVEDVAENSKRRQAEAIQSFEAKRDLAQFEAAKVRWREGDLRACKDLVNRLLERNPGHRGGRLLRAELELFEGRPNEVLPDIEALVQEEPNDAEALYLLGLLQEESGQAEEALHNFEKALKISPQNEVYLASYESALLGEPFLGIGAEQHASDRTAKKKVTPQEQGLKVSVQDRAKILQATAQD